MPWLAEFELEGLEGLTRQILGDDTIVRELEKSFDRNVGNALKEDEEFDEKEDEEQAEILGMKKKEFLRKSIFEMPVKDIERLRDEARSQLEAATFRHPEEPEIFDKLNRTALIKVWDRMKGGKKRIPHDFRIYAWDIRIKASDVEHFAHVAGRLSDPIGALTMSELMPTRYHELVQEEREEQKINSKKRRDYVDALAEQRNALLPLQDEQERGYMDIEGDLEESPSQVSSIEKMLQLRKINPQAFEGLRLGAFDVVALPKNETLNITAQMPMTETRDEALAALEEIQQARKTRADAAAEKLEEMTAGDTLEMMSTLEGSAQRVELQEKAKFVNTTLNDLYLASEDGAGIQGRFRGGDLLFSPLKDEALEEDWTEMHFHEIREINVKPFTWSPPDYCK